MLKYNIALVLIILSLSLAALDWADAMPIRQGVNIEWFRTGTETADGCAIYVWSDTKLGARDLYAQKVDANGNMVWGDPLLVDGKPDRQEDPVITKTSDDNFIIAWIDFSDDLDGSVYAQKVTPSGQKLWQVGGSPVCVYPGIQISLNIEPDDAGGAYIIWEDSRNPGKDLYGQHMNSGGSPVWTVNGIPIANGEGDESYNTMWADGAGGLIIGYVYSLSGAESLKVKRFLPNGQMAWAQPVNLSPSPDVQNKIKMAPINNDSFVFTWMDFRNIDPDIYAQRIDLNGTLLWPDPLVVYSDSTAATPVPQENPRIVQTSDNGVIIIWEDKRNNQDDPDLFAQKLNLNGQLQWDANGVPLSVADFSQSAPRMSSDGNGGCYVVWDDARNGNAPNIDVYAQHLSSTGTSLWQANGLPICDAANEQSGSLVKVSNNNIYVNWMDKRNGSVGIYYQVLNTSGVPQLENNGEVVFWGLSGDAVLKQIIHLPRQNDSVVLWQDTRYANLGYQIFLQIINPDSTLDFAANGMSVTTLTGHDQNAPSAVVLPDDKIAVVWEENRTNNPKIYAQLLDADGTRLWGDEGIAVTDSEPLRQKDARISYLDGALYIGWSNLDIVNTPTGNRQLFHIYGQKIVDGVKQWGPDGILVSQVPTADPYFECQMENLVGCYYVWTRTSTNPDTFGYLNVWVKLLDPDGSDADGWSQYGVVTSDYVNWDLKQYLPKSVVTSDGLFVEWLDFRGDFTKTLYGQMLSPTGQILWNTSGVAMADANREQDDFTLVGGTDITFVWKETMLGTNMDIGIQKYSLTGSPLWGPLGNFVVEGDSAQSSPYLVKFPHSGMAVAYDDYTNEGADIYMRFVEADGTLLGPDTGLIVCDELMIQQYPLIAVLPGNYPETSIIIWSDGRSSGKEAIWGIYAQKFINTTTANGDNTIPVTPPSVTLLQNYPNPFNPETKISFALRQKFNKVELAVYNIKGQKVKTLYKGLADKGNYSYTWDGTDSGGKAASTGVYFYRLTAGKTTLTRKMIMMK